MLAVRHDRCTKLNQQGRFAGIDLQVEKRRRIENEKRRTKEERTMLWTILAVLLILWLLGAIGGIGGSLIHLLLVVAAVVLLLQVLSGRRTIV
jgi:fatty acid desaturase